MNREIRIGTRESQLALWQANKVKGLLDAQGYTTTLVPIKSEGDIDLVTPLYEIGVQGIFTKSLDIALLNGRIDIAVHSLKDVIEFNEKNRDREMPYFGQDIMIKAEAKGPLTSKPYLQALRKNHLLTRTQGIDFVMKKNRLDALIAPTGGPPWPTDWVNGDHFTGGYSSASAVAGYPHITVPAGYVFGLPVGISFFGGAFSEPKLIKIAYAFEQATKARRTPKFLESASFSS